MKSPSYDKINNLKNQWVAVNKESFDRANLCRRYVSGVGQREWLQSALPGEDKEKLVQNYLFKLIQKEKADVSDFSVELGATSLKSGGGIENIKLVEAVLSDIFARSNHLECFKQAIESIYDFGFAVLLSMSEVDEFGDIHLKIFSLNNPMGTFFDVRASEKSKTDGQFCGLIFYDFDEVLESNVEVIDCFYKKTEERDVYVDNNGFTYQHYPSGLKKEIVFEKKKTVTILCHKRFRDQKKVSDIEIGISKTLPFVYIPCSTTYNCYNSGRNSSFSTTPFAWNLLSSQDLLNFLFSSVIEQTRRSGRREIINLPSGYIDKTISGIESILDSGGVLTGNVEIGKGVEPMQGSPQIWQPPPIDPSLLNMLDITTKTLFFLSGFSIAEEGGDRSSTTGAANRSKRENAAFFKKQALEALIKGVKKMGEVLKSIIPYIYTSERVFVSGGDYLTLNQFGGDTCEELFRRHDVEIKFSYGDDMETERNLSSLDKLASTLSRNDQQGREMISYILADSLKGSGADVIKRFVEAGMDDETLEYIKGKMSRADYVQNKQQKMQQMQPPRNIEDEKFELDKKKFELATLVAQSKASLEGKKLELEEGKAKGDLLMKQKELSIASLPKTETINVEKN